VTGRPITVDFDTAATILEELLALTPAWESSSDTKVAVDWLRRYRLDSSNVARQPVTVDFDTAATILEELLALTPSGWEFSLDTKAAVDMWRNRLIAAQERAAAPLPCHRPRRAVPDAR
jgi:hypothetical protein